MAWLGLSLTAQEIDVLAGLQAHIGLLPARTPTRRALEALLLALDRGGAHMLHLDVEHLLHGALDLRLAGVREHPEHDLVRGVRDARALLGDVRRDQNPHQALFVHPSFSSIFLSAGTVIRTLSKATRLTALMRSSIKRLEERNSKASTDIQKQSMQNLNEIVIALREAINNAKNSSSGMGFDQFMQQMEQLANQQEGLNQSTMEMFGQGSLTVEQQAAMQRLARDQEMIRKTLQELQEEMQGNSSVEQRLSQLGSDMEEVAKQLSDKNLTERTKDLQQRILSRMLDAQRSVHKRDFSKKRQSESAKDYRAVDPGALPDNLGENPQILQETMLKALKEGYSKDFEELIRKYFEKLNSGEIKKR